MYCAYVQYLNYYVLCMCALQYLNYYVLCMCAVSKLLCIVHMCPKLLCIVHMCSTVLVEIISDLVIFVLHVYIMKINRIRLSI